VEAITAIIYRKDRSHPIRITEWMKECARSTEPWRQSPLRMLRHKALIQCARVAFGFAGIYDPDEAERIRDIEVLEHAPTPAAKPRRGVGALAETVDQIITATIDEDDEDDEPDVPMPDDAMVLAAYREGFASQGDDAENPYQGDLPGLEEAWAVGHMGGSLEDARRAIA
jgi:hypothetical protein